MSNRMRDVSRRLGGWLLICLCCAARGQDLPQPPPAPSQVDLTGATLGSWMTDGLGTAALFHHPSSAFPDGELSRTGITREVTYRKHIRGRKSVKRKRIQVLAAPSVFQDDRVLFLVPSTIRWDRPLQLVVYFHGWRAMVAGPVSTADEHHLRETLECSGTNTVLVMPQGPYNYPSSRFGRLETINGLSTFLQELGPALPPGGGVPPVGSWMSGVERIILAGHSGGGAPIARLLEDAAARRLDEGGTADELERWMWERIDRMVLLDASYGGIKALDAWWEARPGRSLRSYYLVGSKTEWTSAALAGLYLLFPERREDLEIEAIEAENLPEELRETAHWQMPWYRLWRGLGGGEGRCRWAGTDVTRQTGEAAPTEARAAGPGALGPGLN